MYILIYRDYSMMYTATIDATLLSVADDGDIEIIDISDPTHPLRYFDEGWCSLEGDQYGMR